MSVYKFECPHCHSGLRVRTSRGEHVFLRTLYLQCRNEACSWSSVAELHIKYDLSRPAVQSPGAVLPLAPSAMRRAAIRSCRAESSQMDMLDDAAC